MNKPASLFTLLSLAWPIVISRISQVVVGVSDAVMVAHLGESALAATTTGALNTYSLLILPLGTVFIVSSFASQLFGQGDLAGARRYAFYGLGVAIVTQIVCVLALPAVGPALSFFPYTPEVRNLTQSYLLMRLPSCGAAIGIEALANYYSGVGNTRLPMVANLSAMLLNLVGNWILIDGHLGAPSLGVLGAGLASAVATFVAFFGFLSVFILRETKASGWFSSLSFHEFNRMLKFGIPSGFNWFFEFLAFNFFVNVVVGSLGTRVLAALMSVMQLNAVSFMPSFAIASAGAILVGQHIGSNAKDEVVPIVRLTLLTATAWQVVVSAAYLLMPRTLFSMFLSGDSHTASAMGHAEQDLHEIGTRILMLSVSWLFFDSAASTLAEALRAAGDTTFTLWARLIIAWGVFVPGAYLCVRYLGWGDVGAIFWLASYLGLLSLTLFLRFRKGVWRHIQLTEPVLLETPHSA